MRFAILLGILTSLAACGAGAAQPPRYPGNDGALCRYVGLESAEAPAHDSVDSVMLVATFRLQAPSVPPPKDPIELKFRVNRSRIHELRGTLEAHPDVICRPDHDLRYQVEAKAFDDFTPVQP